MRKGLTLLILLLLAIGVSGQDDKVLMTINGKPVFLSEFIYIYEKNNGDSADYSEESVQEYLDLFTNFKLKVEKAREIKLDTIKALQEELAGYRKQLANSYLMEKELSERLINEMWERRKYDVRIAHILFSLRKNPTAEEIDAAREKALSAKARIQAGENFEDLVSELSEDSNSAGSGGDLGFITAWLPSGFYTLENTAYTLSPGEISEPIVTKLGVHLVKVLEKRPAWGKIEVAHILMRKPEDGKQVNVKAKIDMIYRLIQEGYAFDKLVEQFSEDSSTSKNGGKLNPFGINTFDRAFEAAAFALQKDGDISPPVETRIGWHIIKRLNKPEESFEDFRKRMKPQLPSLDRFEYIKEKLIEEVKEETGYTYNEQLLQNFAATLDSTFLTYRWRVPDNLDDELLMSMGNGITYTLEEFAEYARRNARLRLRFSREKTPQEALFDIFDAFVGEKAMEYEEKNLERKYPDFRALMREYEEGILLFEVSKMEVWDKASQDTTGLRKFFSKNMEHYHQPQKVEIATYEGEAYQREYMKKVYAHASDHTPSETLDFFNAKETTIHIELSDITTDDADTGIKEFRENALGSIINRPDGKVVFSKVLKVHPKVYRSLEDSRGYVIADYQQYLEEQWIDKLKEEFKIEFNESILNSLTR